MRKFIVAAMAVALMGGLAACGQSNTQKQQQAIIKQDVNEINDQLRVLRKNEPLPRFRDSAALHVQDAYYTADADPNKIWYVTMVAIDGTPYAHYITRGAPQPAGDQLTNPVQIACPKVNGNSRHCDVIGLPEPNGVHQGTGGDSYIAISATGAMLRFPQQGAHISDQPFSYSTPVKLAIDETKSISHTDTTKTDNAIVPKGTGTRK